MTDIINDDIAAALEPTDAEQQLQIPDELPLLPLRDIVIYPFMIVPLFVSREKSIRAVDEALGQHRMILLTCQKDLDKEEPQQDDLYNVGTVAVIMRMLKLPDGRIRILVQGVSRAKVESVSATGECLHARLQVMTEVLAPERSLEVEALMRNVRASMEKAATLQERVAGSDGDHCQSGRRRSARRPFGFKPGIESGGRAVCTRDCRHYRATPTGERTAQ